jgi:predicted acetyltransferase
MIGLERPSVSLVSSYLDSIAEMRDLGETIWEGWVPRTSESTSDFVQRVLRAEQSPEPNMVPMSVFWAVSDNAVVDRIALRHHLTASLEDFGGHIGYEVRPSFRRRGVGKEMLRQLLELPKAKEIGRLLLTCAPDNVGSNKTILANGGVLERAAFSESWQRQTNYYWIDLR